MFHECSESPPGVKTALALCHLLIWNMGERCISLHKPLDQLALPCVGTSASEDA
jgi:hypothetical protein